MPRSAWPRCCVKSKSVTPASSRIDEAVPCADPECLTDTGDRNLAEPEQDGDHTYYACTACGYSFGYQRLETVAVNAEGACAVGVPEPLRRAASAAMEQAVAAETRRQPVPLQIGRRNAAT